MVKGNGHDKKGIHPGCLPAPVFSIRQNRLLSAKSIARFQREILAYYKKHGRILPWRNRRNPYRILVSEIMLQQTQVVRVVSKYSEFLKCFPDFQSLATSSIVSVLKVWRGLGYNRRALALRSIAQRVIRDYQGKLPSDYQNLRALPGIGHATASSILAFAYNQPAVFLETNIRRVFLEIFFPKGTRVDDRKLLALVAQTLEKDNPRIWYYALMDYGAMLGKFKNANVRSAHYVRQGKFQGSNRQLRGILIQALLNGGSFPLNVLYRKIHFPKQKIQKALLGLAKEGFVQKEKGRYLLQKK